MTHPLVETMERTLSSRIATLSDAVRSKRVPPQVARAEVDRLQAVLDVMRALEERFDGEDRYTDPPHPSATHAMAHGDMKARRLWREWKPKEEEKKAA